MIPDERRVVQLVRLAYIPGMGTYGRLMCPDGPRLWTVEREWRGNEPSVSCIPHGAFDLVASTYHHGDDDPTNDYPCLEVLDVPGRSLIKFHVANRPADVRGCIGVGLEPGVFSGAWGVQNSRAAMDNLIAWFDAPAILSVTFDPTVDSVWEAGVDYEVPTSRNGRP